MQPLSTHELFSELRAAYIDTLPDKIDEIELHIMALERSHNERDELERLFRSIHNLKGSGGTYGINVLTTACHQMEDELDHHSARIDHEVLLAYTDLLKEIATRAARGEKDFATVVERLAEIKRRRHHGRLHGLAVDISNTGMVVLKQALADYPVSLTFETDGLSALRRLLHEKFDFIIASKELHGLNGVALIGAVRLSEGINSNIHAALITSDRKMDRRWDSGPGRIIHKDTRFNDNLRAFVDGVLETGD